MKKVLFLFLLFCGGLFTFSRSAFAYCPNGQCEINEDPYICPEDCVGGRVDCGTYTCPNGKVVRIFCSSECGGGNTCWFEPTCDVVEPCTPGSCPPAQDVGVCYVNGEACRVWDKCGCAKSCTARCGPSGNCIYDAQNCGEGGFIPTPTPGKGPTPTPAPVPMPSCSAFLTINGLTDVSVGPGEALTYTVSLSNLSYVQSATVSFTSNNTAVAPSATGTCNLSNNPPNCTNSGSLKAGTATGTATITATVTVVWLGRTGTCFSTATVRRPVPTCSAEFLPTTGITLNQGETSSDAFVRVSNLQYADPSLPIENISLTLNPAAGLTISPDSLSQTDCSLTPEGKYYQCRNISVVAGSNTGSWSINAKVYLNPGSVQSCSALLQVTVKKIGPWFQTSQGNVHSGGSLTSRIPNNPAIGPFFSLSPTDTSPYDDVGVVSYASGTLNLGAGYVSSRHKLTPPLDLGWQANTGFSRPRFNYFYEKLGSPSPTNCLPSIVLNNQQLPDADGFAYYNCNVGTASQWTIGTKKLVILTDGEFLINHRINISTGGSLVVVARGNITVGDNVGQSFNIQGIFVTDGLFNSGLSENYNSQLVVNGSVIADNINLRRNLENNNFDKPAEIFNFDPGLMINSYNRLWSSVTSWQEVVP